MLNPFGTDSKLSLKASRQEEKTILKEISFSAPFKIMHPFYLKKDFMTIMYLTASAGIMAGDRQEIEIILEEGANVEFISQAYEKIHRMEEGYATRNTHIVLEKNTKLLYTPLPTIPFRGSDFRNSLRVDLEKSSEFIMSEILTCGRIHRGEFFEYDRYENSVEIYQDGKLAYRDHTRFLPNDMIMDGFGFFEGYTHLGTLLLCNTKRGPQWVKVAREKINNRDLEGGVTITESGYLLIKVLADSAEKIENLFTKLLGLDIETN